MMERTRNRIDPMTLVEVYAAVPQAGDASEVLWDEFGEATVGAIADGCKVLSMLWDSAWQEGNGQAIDDNLLDAVDENELKDLYSNQLFIPSLSLDEISPVL